MALSRKNIIIAVIFTIILYGSIFGYVCVYPFVSTGVKWPSIKDHPALLQDCKPLLNDNPRTRYYPSDNEDANWPASVKALSPVGVYGNKEYVEIRISGGGIGPGWGYLVYPNNETEIHTPYDFIIRETVYPGIFKYVDKQ